MTTPTEPSLRRATISDLPSIRRLNAAAYAKYADRMDRLPEPVLHDYSAEIEAGAVWLLGEPIRAVIVLIDEGDSLLVENVAVQPTAQGTGVGRQLMGFAEQQALARGLRRMTLYTNEVMTENIVFYTRLGYCEYARRAENGYRRVLMEKRLHALSGRPRQHAGG